MKSKKYLMGFTLLACTFVSANLVIIGQQPTPAVQRAADNQYQAGATLYMQKAAEYRALAYQAFNLARWQLDADLKGKNKDDIAKAERKKPRAVVVDIDETVLDNSPSQALGIRTRRAFALTDWYVWGEMGKAKAIPGSVEFLNYAVSR